jgi:hypothetical protein
LPDKYEKLWLRLFRLFARLSVGAQILAYPAFTMAL